jgi:hypothetical protein
MTADIPTDLTIRELEKRQLAGLWLDGRAKIRDESDAIRFIHSVGFALRYNATPGLPLAAMFAAAGEKRLAIQLTNVLLARSKVVETNIIAGRLVLIDAELVPAVYALRLRHRSELSSNALRVLRFIGRQGHATSGDVRRCLRIAGRKRPDPADLALEELQREMLIDRGPSSVPERGIPYLSPEGFPYRVFEDTHADQVRAARRLRAPDAVCSIIERYLQAAVFAAPRKLASIFKLVFSEADMRAGIVQLLDAKKLQQTHGYVFTNAGLA